MTAHRPPYSSPCGRAELDPGYAGAGAATETLELLGELMEAERAGARGITDLCVPLAPDEATRDALRLLARDEGRCLTMLRGHVLRLGGQPSERTGAFYDKLAVPGTLEERLALLNRGQAWVARRIARALPGIDDAALRADLADMEQLHETNIALATGLLADGAGGRETPR